VSSAGLKPAIPAIKGLQAHALDFSASGIGTTTTTTTTTTTIIIIIIIIINNL
jgi:hypothetical protein